MPKKSTDVFNAVQLETWDVEVAFPVKLPVFRMMMGRP